MDELDRVEEAESKDKIIELAWLAWHTAAYMRSKKLPDFNLIIEQIKEQLKAPAQDRG